MEKLSEQRIVEYKYNSREERDEHVKWMESQGYECNGQVRKSDNSLTSDNREYYWYGWFIKRF